MPDTSAVISKARLSEKIAMLPVKTNTIKLRSCTSSFLILDAFRFGTTRLNDNPITEYIYFATIGILAISSNTIGYRPYRDEGYEENSYGCIGEVVTGFV